MQLYYLDSFLKWYLVENIIFLASTLILLKYFHYRKYWFCFCAAIIVSIASASYAVFVYSTITGKMLATNFIPALIFSLSAGLLFGISLLTSNARNRPWLKTSGIFIIAIELVVGFIVFFPRFVPDTLLTEILPKIQNWVILIGHLTPVLFIMNFWDEIRTPPELDPPQKFKARLWVPAGIVGSLFALFFGISLASESSAAKRSEKYNSAKTEAFIKNFESRTFVNSSGDSLPYLLRKPLNYNSLKKYPIVICLPYHGYEGAAAAELLSTESNRKEYPAFLFIPKCPPGSGWGGIPNYPSADSLVYEALNSLKEPGIDVKRRYVTGISRGGYGSWNLICTEPEMFAAAIPVCGGGDPASASKIVGIPVWAFHGEKDINVPVKNSREMIEAIKKAGGNPRYTEYKGEAHNIWHLVSQTPGLLDWLFTQRRI
jgi:hypothetical protein